MNTLLLLLAGIIIILIAACRFSIVGRKITLYLILICLAVVMIMPFYMMFIMATLPTNKIFSYPPIAWFGTNIVNNYQSMLKVADLFRAFLNSLIVTASNTILVLLFCSMGGYAFAVHNFKF